MSGAGSRIAAIGMVLGLAACALVVMPAQPGVGGPEEIGPQLVIDVMNHSAGDVTVTYEFEAGNAGGGGEGAVPACQRMPMVFGTVAGTYEIAIDGEVALDGEVPPAMPRDGFVVVRVVIDPDGGVSVPAQPGWTRIPPDAMGRPLGECG